MTYRLILITFFVFIAVLQADGQKKLSTVEVDKLTYELYLKADWTKLIKEGNSALRQGFDFFYLRTRVGIAYYNLKKYRLAIRHFQKAHQILPTDEIISEYLYYSYLYSGRYSDASKLKSKLSYEMKKRLGIDARPSVSGVFVNYSFNTNKDTDDLLKQDFIEGDAVWGEQTINTTYNFASVELLQEVDPKVSLYHGINYVNISKIQQFRDNEFRGNRFLAEFDGTAKQYAYYINASILIDNGLILSPSLHLLHINTDVYYALDYSPQQFSFYTYKATEYVANIQINKDLWNINVGGFGSVSNLNRQKQWQIGAALIYYPLGNLNLYSVTKATYHNNTKTAETDDYYIYSIEDPEVIINQKIGFAVKGVWIEGFASWGDKNNYNDGGGQVVYNSLGTVKNKYGANLIVPLGKATLNIQYSFFEYADNYRTFTELGADPTYITINSNYYSILGGLKWIF